MKRFAALGVVLLLLFTGFMVAASEEYIKNDAEGLAQHQAILDKIRENLAYAESAGYRALNLKLPDAQSETGTADQTLLGVDSITIIGGVHYIDAPVDIQDIILEKDAVLLNFGTELSNVTVRGTAQYYSIGAGGANRITLTDMSLAYLQDATGTSIKAGGQSELLLLGSVRFEDLTTTDMASLAILGNVQIDAAYQQSTGRIFDPNQMLPVTEGRKTTGGSGTGTAKQEDEGPYPSYIIDWVFNSKPSSPGGSAESSGCSCCECGNSCSSSSPCCSKCTCIYILHAD